MIIHLIRHAKTVYPNRNQTDFERDLLPEGKIQVAILAHYLSGKKLSIDHCFCSDSQRTTQTLAGIKSSVELKKTTLNNDLYLCSKNEFIAHLDQFNDEKEVMFIGHNDGISNFINYLTEEQCILQTCEYVKIELLVDSWNAIGPGTGRIMDQFYPLDHLSFD
ncbi:MAG: histidine phosphatase family protein [Crocinitomicaceae bacterium]|nr:histidine phosphatase family protein [Crocinitomicaceae bacterium]